MSDERDDMPHASESLLQIGDLLPSFTDWGGGGEPPWGTATLISTSPEMGPTDMSEEEWLRELARRIGNMSQKFGAVDRQVRRELELAERMLDSYAILWERRNNSIREAIKTRGDAL